MKHVAIIPAYNEEEFLPITLHSLLNQTVPFEKIVVVDDGSTDNTPLIVNELKERHSTLHLVQNTKSERAVGSKVVRAFNSGLKSICIEDFELISKFDADLEFPQEYNEHLITKFLENDDLGLLGGMCQIPIENGSWKDEKVSKSDHVRGALKTYRVTAFQQIGGLYTMMGWDSADEFALRHHGHSIVMLPHLKVKHFRPTNAASGWIKACKLNAQVYKNLRYGFVLSILSALKRGLYNRPLVLTGLVTAFYYTLSIFKANESPVSKAIGKSTRRYRWKTMF